MIRQPSVNDAIKDQCSPIISQQLPDISTRLEDSQGKGEENVGVKREEVMEVSR